LVADGGEQIPSLRCGMEMQKGAAWKCKKVCGMECKKWCGMTVLNG